MQMGISRPAGDDCWEFKRWREMTEKQGRMVICERLSGDVNAEKISRLKVEIKSFEK